MNTENLEFINMLGKIVTVDNLCEKEIAKDLKIGEYKYHEDKIIAYVIGKNDGITTYKGIVIGVIIMGYDGEKRIIVAKEDSKLVYHEIKNYFSSFEEPQDAFFASLYEKSAGIIPYIRRNNEILYLIIYSTIGKPGFPKGHLEYGETPIETAIRETYEEVGLRLKPYEDFEDTVFYTISNTPINKQVDFFVAEIEDEKEILIDPNEISEFKFVTYEEAKGILNEDLMKVLTNVKKYLETEEANLAAV